MKSEQAAPSPLITFVLAAASHWGSSIELTDLVYIPVRCFNIDKTNHCTFKSLEHRHHRFTPPRFGPMFALMPHIVYSHDAYLCRFAKSERG